MSEWQSIETAPKDKPILAWCNHDADPYVEDAQTGRLTTYGAHCEGLAYATDGYNVVEWGGETSEYGEYNELLYSIPDWWFVVGSDFEVAANPTHWMPLPEPPSSPGEKK